MRRKRDYAEELLFQMNAVGLKPEREFRFDMLRRWRADFAFPDHKLLIEFEGGIYTQGRHTRGKGYENDLEKYNTATLLGFRILRFSASQGKSGKALSMIEQALNQGGYVEVLVSGRTE